MDSMPQESTHDLLLAVAGRVDDDLLAWARELVAVGEDGHALEMLTASLVADRVALPGGVRRRLVQLAAAARIELDAEAELAPASSDDRTTHRFAAEESLAGRVATVLVALPTRQLQDCRVLLTHRRTAAGAAPGPLPHPVLIVEVEPGARRPDMLSYQLTVALERSGVPASVEVLTVGAAVPAYHAEALRSARQLRLDRGAPTGDNRAETTVAVPAVAVPAPPVPAPARPAPALPSRRRSDAASALSPLDRSGRAASGRQVGATQPISAAPPFGTSHSDTPLFDSPTPTPVRSAAADGDRSADAAEPADAVESPSSGRLTAVPSMFDETFPEDEGPADERPAEPQAAESQAEQPYAEESYAAEFDAAEFGRERRGPGHRPADDDRSEARPSPHPKPRPTPITPITRSPGTGPTPIPLLRRNGRRPLAPVASEDTFGSDNAFRSDDTFDSDNTFGSDNGFRSDHALRSDSAGSDSAFGSDDAFGDNGRAHVDHSADYDPLNDPLSRPLMAPVLDPTPPLTGPIGLVGASGAADEQSWSGDWLSGAWAATRDGDDRPAAQPEPEPEKPAARPVRRAPRHRYLRASDPIEDEPVDDRSSGAPDRPGARPPTGAIPLPAGNPAPPSPPGGAIPLPPAGGAIPLPAVGWAPDATGSGAIPMPAAGPPAATTGGVPQTPTRPAIPMPGGAARDPAGPPQRPEFDPALGLRPESLARLGEADLDLLAQLQAELRAERRPHTDFAGSGTPADGLPVGSGSNGSFSGSTNGHGYQGGPASNGHEVNGSHNGSGAGKDGSEHDRNGSSRHGTGQRRGPFGRRRAERSDSDGDGNPPDIAG